MKTLVVLSGKGGAGKTSVTAGLLPFVPDPVLADADVDASNLPLLISHEVRQSGDFAGARVATIDPSLCMGCLECLGVCRFDALEAPDGEGCAPAVDHLSCEGCGACRIVCPVEAIELQEAVTGSWSVSETALGPMAHARLGPGGESSGALVERVRREAERLAREQGRRIVLVDGPPGTGCPAISALTGADLALLVTEPTPSGESDLRRVLDLTRHFDIPAAVLLNKADLHPRSAERLAEWLEARGVPLVGCFPYDEAIVQTICEGRVLSAFSEVWRDRFDRLWRDLSALLDRSKMRKAVDVPEERRAAGRGRSPTGPEETGDESEYLEDRCAP
jgi:MinD superfamily P-loop ATPase